jgi:hypothetical protein
MEAMAADPVKGQSAGVEGEAVEEAEGGARVKQVVETARRERAPRGSGEKDQDG